MNLRFGAWIVGLGTFVFGCTSILGSFDVGDAASSPANANAIDGGVADGAKAGDGSSSAAADGGDAGTRLDHVTSLAAGARHTCAVTSTSDVYCWGDNSNGQLGLPASTPRSALPVKISLPASVSSGTSTIRSIAAGAAHTCVIAGSDLYCWGKNACGQIGAGDIVTPSDPRKVLAPTDEPTVQWTAVSPGLEHTCAIESGGATYCWGCNTSLQAGAIGIGPVSRPVNAGPEKGSASGVSSADAYTCITGTVAQAVRCWGTESNGELGNGDPASGDGTATAVGAIIGSVPSAVSAGGSHTCAIDGNRNIVCWGDGSSGQLGVAPEGGTIVSAPGTRVPLHQASAIASGGAFTCFIAADGTLRCFGSNANGELGRGGSPDSLAHILADSVVRPDSSIPARATALTAGVEHACAVVDGIGAGEVLCWGKGTDGQLGDGNAGGAARAVPVFVLAP